MSFDERIQKLNEVQQGWVNNFRIASIQAKLKDVDGWIRNRLRYCIWHHWKKSEQKRQNLIRLGVQPDQAYAWSRSRMGGWAIAQSPIHVTTILPSSIFTNIFPHNLTNRCILDQYVQWSERRSSSVSYWRGRLFD